MTQPNPFAPKFTSAATPALGGVAAIQAAFAAAPAAATTSTAPFNPFAALAPAAPTPAAAAAAPVALPFPPLNPPGERTESTMPTGAAAPSTHPFPDQAALNAYAAYANGVTPPTVAAAPELTPTPVEVTVVVPPDGGPRARRARKPKAVADAELAPGDAPVEPDADPRNPRTGYSLEEQLAFATVDELCKALTARGFKVGLSFE